MRRMSWFVCLFTYTFQQRKQQQQQNYLSRFYKALFFNSLFLSTSNKKECVRV